MTGIIEGVFIVGAGVKLMDTFRGGEDLKIAQKQCIHELFSKYLAKDFANEGLEKGGGMRVNLRAGANQHINSAYHYLEQYLEGVSKNSGFTLFKKNTNIEIREAVALYLRKWLVSLSTEEGNIDATEVRMHLDFSRQILMRADLFHATGSNNTFLRALAFVCDELEKILDQLQGENRTASRVLDRICHAGRETVNLVIPIMLFSVVSVIPLTVRKMHWNANTILATRQFELEMKAAEAARREAAEREEEEAAKLRSPEAQRRAAEEAAKRKETGEEDEQSAAFLNFWDSPTGKAMYKVLQSKHCTELMEWKQSPAADEYGDYELTVDDVRDYAFGFSTDVLEEYVQFFKSLDSFIYFLAVLQKYQVLAASSGDVLMCYLYATLNHLIHELEVALVHLHQTGAKLLGAGKKQLQTLLKRAKTLPEPQIAWICRLRYIDEEQLGDNHRCMFDLFNELRQLSAMDRLPTVQQAILRNVRSLRDAFNSEDFQARATMPIEGPAFSMLDNVLSRVAATDVSGDNAIADRSVPPTMALTGINEEEELVMDPVPQSSRPKVENAVRNDHAAYPDYYATYGSSSTVGSKVEEPKIEELDEEPSQATKHNASLAWIERALAAEREAQKEAQQKDTEGPQLCPTGVAKLAESTPLSSLPSKTSLEGPKKVPTPSPPHVKMNASSSASTSPVSPRRGLSVPLPAGQSEPVEVRPGAVGNRLEGRHPTSAPFVTAAKADIISFVNSAWMQSGLGQPTATPRSERGQDSESPCDSSPRAMESTATGAAPGMLHLSEEESTFYESLWAVIAVDGTPLDRSMVAQLVEGKAGSYTLNDFERALSFPVNTKKWDFNQMALLLRTLAYMQQGKPVDLSAPPAALPEIAGYTWDAGRSRLRAAQWDLGENNDS